MASCRDAVGRPGVPGSLPSSSLDARFLKRPIHRFADSPRGNRKTSVPVSEGLSYSSNAYTGLQDKSQGDLPLASISLSKSQRERDASEYLRQQALPMTQDNPVLLPSGSGRL